MSICCFATRKSNEASLCLRKRASADCSSAARWQSSGVRKHQGECLAPKRSIIPTFYMSICFRYAQTRYLPAKRAIDICSLRSHSICCLTATRVDSAAHQIVTSLALPNGNAYRARQRHIECASTISSDASAAPYRRVFREHTICIPGTQA